MIKSNKTKRSKSSRKNPRMPTQGNKIQSIHSNGNVNTIIFIKPEKV